MALRLRPVAPITIILGARKHVLFKQSTKKAHTLKDGRLALLGIHTKITNGHEFDRRSNRPSGGLPMA